MKRRNMRAEKRMPVVRSPLKSQITHQAIMHVSMIWSKTRKKQEIFAGLGVSCGENGLLAKTILKTGGGGGVASLATHQVTSRSNIRGGTKDRWQPVQEGRPRAFERRCRGPGSRSIRVFSCNMPPSPPLFHRHLFRPCETRRELAS